MSVCLLAGAVLPTARAELVGIEAVVDATVVQFDTGTAVQVDRETLTVTEGQTGTAIASVDNLLGTAGPITAAATSTVFFVDPFSPLTEPIREFGGALAAFSGDPHINHQVTGDVFESRTIRVTVAEAGVESGSLVAVTGEMLLHGGILVWSDREDGDLSTLEAKVGFEIELRRAGHDPLFVLSGVVEVQGQSANRVSSVTKGVLDIFNPAFVDLSADFPELGNVYLIMFPQVLLPYVYQVNVMEQYELIGRLRLKATTVPDEVGVAVTAGGPFDQIDPMIQQIVGGDVGSRLQQRVNAELASFPEPVPPTIPFELIQENCAPMGAEALGLTGLLGFLSLSGARRRFLSRPRRRGR